MPNIPKNIAAQHNHSKLRRNIAAMIFAVPVLTTGFSDTKVKTDSFSPNAIEVVNRPENIFSKNDFLIKTANITDKTVEERLHNKELYNTLLGALVFLEDTQVRNRTGLRSSEFDTTLVGDGAKSRFTLNLPVLNTTYMIPIPGLTVYNREGEWFNDINIAAGKLGPKGKTVLGIPDSNMFVPSLITYSLFTVKDPPKGDSSGSILEMRNLALENIAKYKRNDAYSFWPQIKGSTSPSPRIGPPNLFLWPITLMIKTTKLPIINSLWEKMQNKEGKVPSGKEWRKGIFDTEKNPIGGDAFFNITNDADDTAMAVTLQWLSAHSRNTPSEQGKPEQLVDKAALDVIEKFRDINRTREDTRDAWKGKDSGAYLTWLKDENKPLFEDIDQGVMCLSVNNVDAVVNANVILAMALCGKKDAGYHDAVNTMVKCIENKDWDKAGLYYSQRMMFPYAISRAYRDGGANEPELKRGLKILLTQILDEQDKLVASNPQLKGTFSGGEKDPSLDLPTALGVVTLLNIGSDLAKEAGEFDRYEKSLSDGLNYILQHRQNYEIQNPETYNSTGISAQEKPGDKDANPKGYMWESGLIYGASAQGLAQWRSKGFTVAVALEAMAKYLLGYDIQNISIKDGARLELSNLPKITTHNPEKRATVAAQANMWSK